MGGRFLAKKKENQSSPKGDQNYGPNCNKPDMNPEEFEIAKADYVAKNMNLDGAKLQEIYVNTKGQNDNWIFERSKRITATYFHRIASRKIKYSNRTHSQEYPN
ncbi:hypothetical protein QYM36_016226 [Artemia franciscana]|uniref:Uncharacterized protein n=1 Tax=Artemia franciscana TaxID=6661 RepID=A0AA88HI83_ARTSF|nr:hypothetical protein QYM36_016226 [Artemia franciscana]